MKTIALTRWSPDGRRVADRLDVAMLLDTIGSVGVHADGHRTLPSRHELNAVLAGGTGDDGWIGLTWEPFELTQAEYDDLVALFAQRFDG